MQVFRIPVESSVPDQSLEVELDGTIFRFRIRWNDRAECWHFDLFTVDGDPIAYGVKLVIGWPLLRRSLHPARPAGKLFALDLTAQGREATFDDFGERVQLFYKSVEV